MCRKQKWLIAIASSDPNGVNHGISTATTAIQWEPVDWKAVNRAYLLSFDFICSWSPISASLFKWSRCWPKNYYLFISSTIALSTSHPFARTYGQSNRHHFIWRWPFSSLPFLPNTSAHSSANQLQIWSKYFLYIRPVKCAIKWSTTPHHARMSLHTTTSGSAKSSAFD